MFDEPQPAPRRTAPRALLGVIAVVLAALMLVVEIVAIVVGSAGGWPLATLLAWIVIAVTALSVISGVAAVVLRRGRRWGVIAIVLGVVANPLVQIAVLGLFGGH